jgi:hypothetical protein
MTEKMDSLGVCPECCKSYDEPILLPCLHNFCRKCIAGISETTGSRSQAACPQCQEQFAIPKAGVDGLPRNSFLENYLKLKDICGSSDQPCDLCNSDDADAEQLKFATVYCLVCRQKFCSSCASIHSKINVCRKHEQINLGEEDVDSVSAMIKSPTICDKHRQKRLKYYCGTCRQALCQLCYVEKHQSHKCSDLAEPAEKLREQVKKDTTSLTELLEECRRMLAKVSSDNDTFDDQIISIENELHARADQLKDEIDREVEQLLEEMAVIRKKRSEEVEKACDEIKQRMASLEHGMSYIEELATKGSPGDILQQTRVIQDRTLRLKNFDSIRQAFKGLGSTTVKFVPSGVSNGVGTKLIGKVISGNSNGKVVPERSTEEVADKNEDGRAVSTKSNGPNGQMACDSSIRKTQGEEVDNVSVVSIEKGWFSFDIRCCKIFFVSLSI